MAAAARHLSRMILQVGRRVPTKRKCQRQWPCPLSQSRNLSTSFPRLARSRGGDDDEDNNNEGRLAEEERMPQKRAPRKPITKHDLNAEERADLELLSPQEQEEELHAINTIPDEMELPEIQAEMTTDAEEIMREVDKEEPLRISDDKPKGKDVGFWADDEDDEFGQVPDEDDEFLHDDMTSIAHADLELHREIREYQRVAAWDMPLLKKFAIPFEPPPIDQPLRFRYTTYMGESHPAAKKVVLEFCTRDLLPSLTDAQRLKLIKLVGVRYNPDTDVVKISCEKFETSAQNKRYLGDMVSKLVAEAKDPSKDTFEDIPLDFRHHKRKPHPQFPEDWKLGQRHPEQLQKLVRQREEAKLLEQGRRLIDGTEIVKEYVNHMPRLNQSSVGSSLLSGVSGRFSPSSLPSLADRKAAPFKPTMKRGAGGYRGVT